MNSLGIIILVALLLFRALEQGIDFLNLFYAQKAELPEDLQELYPGDKHAKAKDYLRAQTIFGLQESSASMIAFLLIWLGGSFSILDAAIRRLQWGSIPSGLAFFGVIALAQALFGLPFRYYHTFVLEERFGFNKTTLTTFIGDTVKGALIGLAIGAPLLAAVLWFFENIANAWLWVWGLLVGVQLLLAWIAPLVIFPLFFKFEALTDGPLCEAIEAFARKVSFQMAGIFVIDGSRRSTKANAFFTGMGKSKRVALFDTLLKNNSVAETVAVLAHEVGHYKRGHIWKGFFLGAITTGLMAFSLGFVLQWSDVYEAFDVQPSIYAGLFFAMILYGPFSKILAIVSSAFSRKHEYEADAFAAKESNAQALISALKKLSDANLSNPTPHPWKVFLEYSHPPLLERIRALRK